MNQSENIKKGRIATVAFSFVQGNFWMTFCIIFSFTSVFLLAKGYSNTQIGLVIAIAGGISAVLQPMVATFADNSKKVSLRNIIAFFAVLIIVAAGVLLFVNLRFLLLGVFYGIMVTFLQILTPLINSLGMECINQGIPVNFGLARGVGSVSYALISYVAGELVTRYNTTVIPILIIILYSFLLVFVLTFRFAKEKGININNKENNTKTKIATEIVGIQEQRRSGIHEKSTSFFVKYPKFLFLILGATITFISHNIINNFMFQIMEYHGGGSCEMGIAMGLAAGMELPTMIAFGYVIKKVSPGALLRISGIFFAMKAFMMFMAGSILTIYIAQSAQILGFALFVPASVYYVNELVEQKDRVKGQAYMTVTNTLGSIFGSLFGGFILDEKGVSVMLLVSFVMGIIGMLIIFGSINRTREKAII